MFPKAASIFQIDDISKLAALTEERLAQYSYEPIQGPAAMSQGFDKVQDVFAYRYMGHILMHLTVQKKSVPASAVKARVKEVCDALAKENGHQPGRKRVKEVKLAVIDELMARAIPTTKTHSFFIDTTTGRVVIHSTSGPIIGAINSLLYQAAEIQLNVIKMPSRATVTSWLQDFGYAGEGIPEPLTADDFFVFEHPGEGGKTVKYERSDLTDDDVLANIEAGAEVLSLALTYDDKVSFVYKDGQLSKIKAIGVLAEKPPANKEDAFQSAFYLAASEMAVLTQFLHEAA